MAKLVLSPGIRPLWRAILGEIQLSWRGHGGMEYDVLKIWVETNKGLWNAWGIEEILFEAAAFVGATQGPGGRRYVPWGLRSFHDVEPRLRYRVSFTRPFPPIQGRRSPPPQLVGVVEWDIIERYRTKRRWKFRREEEEASFGKGGGSIRGVRGAFGLPLGIEEFELSCQ